MSLGKKRKPAASEDHDVSPQRKPAASEDHDDYLLRAGMLRAEASAGARTSSDKKRKPAASDDGDGEHDMWADTNRKGSKKGGKGSGGKGSGGKGSSGGSFGDVLKKALQQPRPAAVGSAAKGNVELKKRIKTEKVAREEKKILLEKRKWFQKEHVLPDPADLNHEKLLLKLATKGVVKLFNVIQQQQKTRIEQAKSRPGDSAPKPDKLTKNEFLSMLKSGGQEPAKAAEADEDSAAAQKRRRKSVAAEEEEEEEAEEEQEEEEEEEEGAVDADEEEESSDSGGEVEAEDDEVEWD